MAKHRIIGIDFSHMHMGDLLRLVCEHGDAEVVGAWHTTPEKPREVLELIGLPESLIYTDWEKCLAETEPTVAVLCAPPVHHLAWGQRIAAANLDLLVEKPFASSLEHADAMINAFSQAGRKLAINWPLAWYPTHQTTKRLIDEGLIGSVVNIHYYDGNRGPVFHKMDKIEVDSNEAAREKQKSWFYQKDHGGGSLFDYLGYGATLGSWFNNGQRPLEVTSIADQPAGLEVDEHSVTVARYASGLYKFETRWGTFTDPWVHQPAPKCGFVICGTKGTICSYDFEETVRVQTREHPEGYDIQVDVLDQPATDPISYFLHCLDEDLEIEGPLSPTISRLGQQIVDTAASSAALKQTVSFKKESPVPTPHIFANASNSKRLKEDHGRTR